MYYFELDNNQKVPRLGFGTWQIQKQECVDAVKAALEIGYRHIDTAQIYDNEAEVGRALEQSPVSRNDVFLTTKVWRDNLSYDQVKKSTQKSLEKLKTDYVNLLLIHWPTPQYDLAETLGAMQELLKEGKTLNIGVSNFPISTLDRAIEIAPQIVTDQIEYHLFLDQSKVIQFARSKGLFITAYSPLARGRIFKNDIIKNIADKYGKSPAQISLRWLIEQDHVVAIPKASSPEHARNNFDIFDFELTPEDRKKLNSLGTQKGRIIDPNFAPEWDV